MQPRQLVLLVAGVGLLCYTAGRLSASFRACPVVATAEGGESALRVEQLGNVLSNVKKELQDIRNNIKANLNRSPSGTGLQSGEVVVENVKEIVSMASGQCLDNNPIQYQDMLMTWTCHRGGCVLLLLRVAFAARAWALFVGGCERERVWSMQRWETACGQVWEHGKTCWLAEREIAKSCEEDLLREVLCTPLQ